MHKHSEFFKLIHECQKQNIDLSVLLGPGIAAFRRLVSDAARDMNYAVQRNHMSVIQNGYAALQKALRK